MQKTGTNSFSGTKPLAQGKGFGQSEEFGST